MRGLTLVAVLLCCRIAAADPPSIDINSTPIWAARAALADAQQLPPEVATRSRWVWLRSGSQEELAALSFVLNSTLSRVNIAVVPGSSAGAVPLAGGHLVRLDLGILATDLDDFANLVTTWELLARRDSDFTARIVERKKVVVPRYRHTDGKFYTARWENLEIEGPAAHVVAEVTALTALTQSLVPVIDGRELQATALTTLENGIYYELRGIKPDATLKGYLASRGASEEQVNALESLEKAVILQSKVTAKDRAISVFRGAGVRASTGGGLVALTFDPFDEDRAANDFAIRNLLNFRGRGSEVILELANGFHEWTLWNEAGRLVRVAPPNLVSDHTVPEPFTANLQPGLSCIRCHANEDGWRGLRNDVPAILAAGTDIFGDLSSGDERLKQVQLLAGLYSGDWFAVGVGPLSVGRLSYNKATLGATGRSIKDVSTLISVSYDAYAYQLLDAWGIAKELGLVGLPPSDNNPETPADLQAATIVLKQFIGAQPVNGEVAREDGVIAAICAGIPVSRRSWQTASHLAYERAYQRGMK